MKFPGLITAVQALRSLGVRQVGLFGLYQLGLRSGYFRLLTPIGGWPADRAAVIPAQIFNIPTPDQLKTILGDRLQDLIQEADEIQQGLVRLFGGSTAELNLAPPGSHRHWSRSGRNTFGDIKVIWEPARFGLAFTLGRAFICSGDEAYAQAFWHYFEQFTAANPVNCGENWMSAQEAALRLIAFAFAAQVFGQAEATTETRKQKLAEAMAQHARRIPPTLIYARAQGNNHLVSEALGLYLAGNLLANDPQAPRWRRLGWKWLNRAIQQQILQDGSYVQHSTNYLRLLLELALVARAAAHHFGDAFPARTREKLARATEWYLSAIDRLSGMAVNLGHNDGAHLLPLCQAAFSDHRATAQAASLAFLGNTWLEPGPWDELSAWLGLPAADQKPGREINSPIGLRKIGDDKDWGTLRAVWYNNRPAHADQLQVDLWHAGVNILRDAGTYAYNLPAPWDNGLASARAHNAPVIDGREPMRRAGRFLWLSWDQARWLEGNDDQTLAAERTGYQALGLHHRRWLTRLEPGAWQIRDILTGDESQGVEHTLQMNWLLPDGNWQMEENLLRVSLPGMIITVQMQVSPPNKTVCIRLVRAGEAVFGSPGDDILYGWYSPTYLQKQPALSLLVGVNFRLPVEIITLFHIQEQRP